MRKPRSQDDLRVSAVIDRVDRAASGFWKVEVLVFPGSAIGAQPSAVELQSRATAARNAFHFLPFSSISGADSRLISELRTHAGKKFFLSPSSWTKADLASKITKTSIGTYCLAQAPAAFPGRMLDTCFHACPSSHVGLERRQF
jgi:hypothetical protein